MKYFSKDPNISQQYGKSINKKGSKKYPFEKIDNKVKWFVENYKYLMKKEKWDIEYRTRTLFFDKYEWISKQGLFFIKPYPTWTTFKGQGMSMFSMDYQFTPDIMDIKKAREYGWLIDNVGIIYDFSDKYFRENKYKITGLDLGLL